MSARKILALIAVIGLCFVSVCCCCVWVLGGATPTPRFIGVASFALMCAIAGSVYLVDWKTRNPDWTLFRSGWLDRWLEPRWRALLTWVVLAVLGASMARPPVSRWISESARFTHQKLFEDTLGSLPQQVSGIGVMSIFILLHVWFPPLLLRLGPMRTIIWIILGVGYSFGRGVAPLLSQHLSWQPILVVTLALGLPGLAVSGRRTRPWMGFIAGGLSVAFIVAWHFGDRNEPWKDANTPAVLLGDAIFSLIYGAVMLYGTDPLPRRAAERQLGEDQR